MRVRWTIPAAADLDNDDLYHIVRHIQQDNPQAAADAAESPYDGCASLGRFPHIGRKGRIEGPRTGFFRACTTSSFTGSGIKL
jgi:plasmid stabilization system protein ParE